MTVRRVLIANRGEIALRVIRACHARGIEAVLAVSEADRDSLAARHADRTVCIGPARASASYLDAAAIVTAAVGTGADAVHPGYGFLAENADFAALVEDHGLRFIGPRPSSIRHMGDKVRARHAAAEAGVPVLAASPPIDDERDAQRWMDELGGPVMVKASAGGGGRGIRRVSSVDDVVGAVRAARSEAIAAFGDGTVYLERFITRARHIEVQVVGDGEGHAVHLGERDCTIQRRHQKVLEEALAVSVPTAEIERLRDAAVDLAASLSYRGVGTVEFIHDPESGTSAFLEMNTRIQVEHPVTEAVTGCDLIGMQLDIAAGETSLPRQEEIVLAGHAIEVRIAAEDPANGFAPSPGRITGWEFPTRSWLRLDSGVEEGSLVGPHYDSMIAKLIVHGPDRRVALERLGSALADVRIEGITSNVGFLSELVADPTVVEDRTSTTWLDERVVTTSVQADLSSRSEETR